MDLDLFSVYSLVIVEHSEMLVHSVKVKGQRTQHLRLSDRRVLHALSFPEDFRLTTSEIFLQIFLSS